jgi:hypothetical protein
MDPPILLALVNLPIRVTEGRVFAVQRQDLGWGASYDTTIGLRLHTDVAHQVL